MIKQSQDVLQNIFQKAFKLEFGEICDNCELLRLWITKFAGIKPVFPVFTVLKGGNFPPHLKNPRPMGRGFVRWGGKNFSARFARPAPPLPHLTASRLENPPHLNFRLDPALILLGVCTTLPTKFINLSCSKKVQGNRSQGSGHCFITYLAMC